MWNLIITYWPELVTLAGFILGELAIAAAACWVEQQELK
jgi:hypothetical protein